MLNWKVQISFLKKNLLKWLLILKWSLCAQFIWGWMEFKFGYKDGGIFQKVLEALIYWAIR